MGMSGFSHECPIKGPIWSFLIVLNNVIAIDFAEVETV